MAELTNLTDRLTHLRDREGSPLGMQGGSHEPPSHKKKQTKLPERRFANDYFMIFVYVLLGIATCSQFALIVLFDLI